jgi:hypothetical protein
VRRLAALEAIASLSGPQVCPPRSHLHPSRGLTHGDECAQEAISAKLHSTCLKAIASHLKKVDIDTDEHAIVSLAHLLVHPDQRTADAAKTNLNSFLTSHGELPDRVEKELMTYCVAQWNNARADQQDDTATRLGQVVCGLATAAVSKLPRGRHHLVPQLIDAVPLLMAKPWLHVFITAFRRLSTEYSFSPSALRSVL